LFEKILWGIVVVVVRRHGTSESAARWPITQRRTPPDDDIIYQSFIGIYPPTSTRTRVKHFGGPSRTHSLCGNYSDE